MVSDGWTSTRSCWSSSRSRARSGGDRADRASLRLGHGRSVAVSEGLDQLVLTGIATSGNQAPGTHNLLVSIRKAITTIRAAGYNPDTLVLTPAADETIDTMVSGISGGTADFTFGPGRFSPSSLFGLTRVVSKSVPARSCSTAPPTGGCTCRRSARPDSRSTPAPRTGATSAWGLRRLRRRRPPPPSASPLARRNARATPSRVRRAAI